jgi:hypothetical protein
MSGDEARHARSDTRAADLNVVSPEDQRRPRRVTAGNIVVHGLPREVIGVPRAVHGVPGAVQGLPKTCFVLPEAVQVVHLTLTAVHL